MQPKLVRFVRKGDIYSTIAHIWEQIREGILSSQEVILVLRKSRIGQYENGCKFAMIVRIIKEIMKLHERRKNRLFHERSEVIYGPFTTIRDIYYKDVELFNRNQDRVSRIVRQIAQSLNVSLEQLQIVPGSKGLIYGDFRMEFQGKTWLDASLGPSLIPIIQSSNFELFTFVGPTPRAIVVLEKEAIFRSVYSELKNCIVITGKGFPCHLTKKFLFLLATKLHGVPVLGFVDSDVYGRQICNNYCNSEPYPIPKMIWAGVNLLEYKNGWLDLSLRDWSKMQTLARTLQVGNFRFDHNQTWHREICRGMILFKKSEMNVIQNDYSQYIIERLESYTYAKHKELSSISC